MKCTATNCSTRHTGRYMCDYCKAKWLEKKQQIESFTVTAEDEEIPKNSTTIKTNAKGGGRRVIRSTRGLS